MGFLVGRAHCICKLELASSFSLQIWTQKFCILNVVEKLLFIDWLDLMKTFSLEILSFGNERLI